LFDKETGVKCLKNVADFVNNVKHFDNKRSFRLHPDTFFVGRDAQAGGWGPSHTWWIQSGEGKRINAYILADESFSEIEKFMVQGGLIK
jgi:hypothetical protein